MSIRIGANPIGWSNDDMLELGGNIPLEQCLTEAKAAGFEGMELGNKFPRDAAKLKPILDAHGLDLVSGWYSCELLNRDADAEMAAMRPHLDLLKAMGCKVVIVAETSNAIHGDRSRPLSERPVLESDRWEAFGARMTELAEKTLNEGLRLVYHHHMGTIVQSFEDINAFMAATGDAVHLLFDTGHARWGGSEPAAIASMHKARISHIHCKDLRGDVAARAASENMSFLDAVVEGVYTVPGDGGIDFVSALKPLAGYSGWVVVEAEQDPEKAHPATYAKMGYDNLSRYLREAGLM
ncbi:myo-inosose-2 dehydratase [Stappia sp. F7233]|uniref:Myo-inosose-2 dehydratase n=1 Tax=Stappia albiluteola TaxID=2758565 RepID=A0A839AHH6_9HYPH|nr:myo-inosose-2 dehydratase [Stappia albiluteola]MBA5779171.1 myo-inosose-2 dehydratase [Stappia albiluteola]